MGTPNKLGVFFIGVNLLLPSLTHALIIEPIKIDSSQGEPLYAEIPFHNANSQNSLQVSVAQPFELGVPEAEDPAKYAHYNFYVRQNNQGNGVIVITSNRPINENNLNLVLKINDSGQVHIQQLRNKLPSRIERLQTSLQDTPLQPRIVVDEKALALNLPTTSNTTDTDNGNQLVVQQTLPPPLMNSPKARVGLQSQTMPTAIVTAPTPVSTSPISTQNTVVHRTEAKPQESLSSNLNISVSQRPASPTTPIINNSSTTTSSVSIAAAQPIIEPSKPTLVTEPVVAKQQPTPLPQQPAIKQQVQNSNNNAHQHTVKANESLWAIANQIAKSQNISVQTVMKDIHKNNKQAFIGGNASRLRQGVILNIPTEYSLPAVAKQEYKSKPVHQENIKPNAPQTTVAPTKQTQAHMSIVANDTKGATQGTHQNGQIAQSTQQNELTIKLKQERNATLTLQNNVRQLDQQLKQKERRIALLNARLAELEQQLKSRKAEQEAKDASKTSSRSQNVVPAIIAGTLVAFAGLNNDFAIATML